MLNSSSINPARLLLVDDEPHLLRAFEVMLKQRGFDVRSALSVVMAIAIMREWPPDVVLSDYSIPGQNGGDLLNAIRQLFPELVEKLEFIFITGQAASVAEDIRCRGVRVLEKPLRCSVLCEILGAAGR